MEDVKVALDELKEDSDSGRLQAAPAAARPVTPVRLVIVAVAVVASSCCRGRMVLAGPATPCRTGGAADRCSPDQLSGYRRRSQFLA